MSVGITGVGVEVGSGFAASASNAAILLVNALITSCRVATRDSSALSLLVTSSGTSVDTGVAVGARV